MGAHGDEAWRAFGTRIALSGHEGSGSRPGMARGQGRAEQLGKSRRLVHRHIRSGTGHDGHVP